MPDRHVQPHGEEWTVTVPGDDQVTARTATEVEAVERAVNIVADHGGGQVVVHGTDGEVVETRHVDAGASTPEISRTAAEIAENAGVEGAVETVEEALSGSGRNGSSGGNGDSGSGEDLRGEVRAAVQDAGTAAQAGASEAADTAEDVAREASTTAKKVRGHTRTAARRAGGTAAAGGSRVGDEVEAVREGDKSVEAAAQDAADAAQTTAEQLADQAEGTAREVAGETRAAGRRAATRVDATAREAREQVAAGADRAAALGADVGDEAESAADRVGQQIHAYTEAAAAPLDHLAQALNPVRVTGRVVGVLVSGGLHLLGVGAARGTAAAQQGAHRVTGH
jgi:hypothetical protein